MIKFTNGRLFSTARSVVIVGAKRTPVGGFMGALKAIPAPQLGAIAVRGAIEQAGIQPEDVEEGIMGCVLQASLGQAPDRQAILGAGCSVSTPTTAINKVCASGMKALMVGASQIRAGDRNIVVAGGMENMSRAPHYTYLREPTGYGHATMPDAT